MTTLLLRLRNRHFLILDLVALAAIPSLALALRLDSFQLLGRYAEGLLIFTLVGLAVRLFVFWRGGLYSRYWRYASTDEIALIVVTVAATTGITTFLFTILPSSPFALFSFSLPRSLPLIDGMLTLMAVGGSRFSIRLAEHWRQRGHPSGRRVLIIGAGDAGRLVVRELQGNPHLQLEPVGFVDDDQTKHGMKIYGLPVLGGRDDLSEIVHSYKVSQAIIAMPTAPGKTIRHFVELCEEAGTKAKTIPGIYELLSGQVSVSEIRNVEIDDLLRREPVRIETDEVVRMVQGKRILITGAGGSIGSEICRQLAQFGAAELILLGHGETSIFKITRELRRMEGREEAMEDEGGIRGEETGARRGDSSLHSPRSIIPVIADIRDHSRLESVFERHRPHIVFHAAAHKHVPLMEHNVAEAVNNNVSGTKCLIEVAERAGVDCFVLISTDKAVNPTSVMGVTKRVAEKLVESAACTGRTFVAVRFGNVLGSRGSVVQVFREQIARGGPVTVTDPEMRRYFMTIPEAVQLVLQAAALGRGGETFVLDMGNPVPIDQLARDLIKLSGLELGRDIDITYTGIRPGEKLFEELFTEGEAYQRTHHEKIFVSCNGTGEHGNLGAGAKTGTDAMQGGQHTSTVGKQVEALITAAHQNDLVEVRRLLHKIVPEYQPPSESRGGTSRD